MMSTVQRALVIAFVVGSSILRPISAQRAGEDLARLTVPPSGLPANCRLNPSPGGFIPTNPAIVTDPTTLGFMHSLIFGPMPGEPDRAPAPPAAARDKALADAMAARGASVEVGYAAAYQETGGSPEIGVFALRLKAPPGVPVRAAARTIAKGSVVIFYWSDAQGRSPDLGCVDVVRRHLETVDLR